VFSMLFVIFIQIDVQAMGHLSGRRLLSQFIRTIGVRTRVGPMAVKDRNAS
jgi:hypothetical protein